MQPYTYPYLGYFQLIKSIDTFVFFDDVQFIRRGFINRNNILINGKANKFTVPVIKGSQEDLISQIKISAEMYAIWRGKFLKSLKLSYKKAPHFEQAYRLVESVLNEDFNHIASLAKHSIISTCNYLGLERNFIDSSSLDYNRLGTGEDKILDICRIIEASSYVNSINGKDLYHDKTFNHRGIELLFIEPDLQPYKQGIPVFEGYLSIIDALMWMAPEDLQSHLDSYRLIEK